MRRKLIALALALAVALVALVAVIALGVRPFAGSAPVSVAFVAISRSADEADAREIEAIDLAAGTRELFDAGGRITALAVSTDRRSLYVAVDAGRIVFLDATTGTRFADLDLRGPTITSLVPDRGGHTLYAITATSVQGSIVPIDLDARKVGEAIILPAGANAAVLRGGSLLVAIADPRSLQVLFVDPSRRVVTDRLILPRGSLAAPTLLGVSDTRAAVVAFAPAGSGGGVIHVYLITDPLHWDDVALPAPFGVVPARGQAGLFAAATPSDGGGSIEVCVLTIAPARRYLISPDKTSSIAGSECGPMTGGGAQILLGRRDPPQLLVLDAVTGAVTRTLPLAGVPARLVR